LITERAPNMYTPLLQYDRVIELQGTVQLMAEKAFNSIDSGTRSRDAPVAPPTDDDLFALQAAVQPLSAVDANRMFEYLTARDGLYMTKIIAILRSCIADVFSDNTLSLTDLPSLLKAIHQACSLVNEVNGENTTGFNLTSADIATLMQALFTLVCVMVLPPAQYALIIEVIGSIFLIVRTQLVPLMKRHEICCFLPFLNN
jgi:hypothetical protein